MVGVEEAVGEEEEDGAVDGGEEVGGSRGSVSQECKNVEILT